MSAPGPDPRVTRGLERMLELRRRRLAAGERPIGWKVGFGAPAAMEKLGIDRPLVGFLTDRSLVHDGARVPLAGWTAAAFEAEIAVQLGEDVPGDATADQVRAAVRSMSAAIELADIDAPPEDPETILAGNIFHRHVILGPAREDYPPPGSVSARVLRDGDEVAGTNDPSALTGEVFDVVGLTAAVLASAGEGLAAGDTVITGSVVPPVQVGPGQRLTAELDRLGTLHVDLV